MGGCTSSLKEEKDLGLLDLPVGRKMSSDNDAEYDSTQYAPKDYVVDPQNPPPIIPSGGFRVELGSNIAKREIVPVLEKEENFRPVYKDEYFSRDHVNYVGGNLANPIVISVQFDQGLNEWKVLVRTKKSDEHYAINPCPKSKLVSKIQQLEPSLAAIKFKEVKNDDIKNDLKHLEDRLLIKNYKFGVVYCKEGQLDEDSMFSNEHGSPKFDKFLELMGDKIKLKGWERFDGELDVKSDSTGPHSVFTQFDTKNESFQIMFHVSTLLPFSPVNNQQIERKRHIGNDIVVIIFQDSPTPLSPSVITSKYNHVYIVVQYLSENEKGDPKYRIAVASKDPVRPFGPPLPREPVFRHGKNLRNFLLTKAVNAERASYSAPSFGVTRTRRDWLKTILVNYGAS